MLYYAPMSVSKYIQIRIWIGIKAKRGLIQSRISKVPFPLSHVPRQLVETPAYLHGCNKIDLNVVIVGKAVNIHNCD